MRAVTNRLPHSRRSDAREGTELSAPRGTTLRLHRVLRPAPENTPLLLPRATGHVAGCWNLPDGTRARGLFVTLHTGPRTWAAA